MSDELRRGMATPSTEVSDSAIKRDWPVFTEAVLARLCKGATDYGDSSFHLSTPDLVAEVEQELFDVMGWTFVLWCRMRKLASVNPPGAITRPPGSGSV